MALNAATDPFRKKAPTIKLGTGWAPRFGHASLIFGASGHIFVLGGNMSPVEKSAAAEEEKQKSEKDTMASEIRRRKEERAKKEAEEEAAKPAKARKKIKGKKAAAAAAAAEAGEEKPSTRYFDVWLSRDGGNLWEVACEAAPWVSRSNFGAVAHEGRIWVVGGAGDAKHLNDVWCSATGEEWVEVSRKAPFE